MSASGQEIELLTLSNDEEKDAKKLSTHKRELTELQHNSTVSEERIYQLRGSNAEHDEVAEPLSLAGVQELRGILSEALSTSLFTSAVVIVFLFNFLYSMFNSFRQDSAQDTSNDTISKCHCNGHHKTFYVIIVLSTSIAWFLSLVFEKFYIHFVQPGRYDRKLHEMIRSLSKFECYFTKELNVLLSSEYDDQNIFNELISRLRLQSGHTLSNINSASSEVFDTDAAVFDVPNHLKNLFPNVILSLSGESYYKKSLLDSVRDNMSRQYGQFRRLKSRHKAIVSFKLCLMASQFLAQLFIVPLLELQWLDQYAWVCVAGISRNYCNSDKDVYNLALDQAVVVYMFYASILFAALLSMVVNWLPRYQDKQV